MSGRLPRLGGNLLLAAGALAVSLLAAEAFLRWRSPPVEAFGAAAPLPWMRDGADWSHVFTVDPRFGFRPILANETYSEFGTLRNDYSVAKTPGRARLLFVGDSVTARGALVNGIARIYGEERYEYWNAGVESFNTLQEVEFYFAFNAALEPDHVILTFHLNDFQTTPIAFVDDDGRLVAFAPNQPLTTLSPWLFVHSKLYRLWLGVTRFRNRDVEGVAREVEDSLRHLRDQLERDGVRFTVLVLPLLRPLDEWKEFQVRRRLRILGFLETERIRHFDLLPPLVSALRRGVKVQQRPGDTWHPSAEIGQVFGNYLAKRELLTAR